MNSGIDESWEKICEGFRNELPVLRAKDRISQEELARKIGVSRQTYCAIENGTRKMSQTVLLALIAYFQNNDSTKDMLESISGLKKYIGEINL